MNTRSKVLVSVLLVVAGIKALVAAIILNESFFGAAAIFFPCLVALLWFDGLEIRPKQRTSAALVIAGIALFILGMTGTAPLQTWRGIGMALFVAAGFTFAFIGFSYYMLCMRDWPGEKK